MFRRISTVKPTIGQELPCLAPPGLPPSLPLQKFFSQGNSLTGPVFWRILMVPGIIGQFLAVNLRTMKTKMRWRAQLIMLCALVFMFALHAKTSVYSGTGPAKVTPSTASKLWLSGQKMEVQSVDSGSGMLFWMAVLCLVGLYLHRELRARARF